MTPADQKQLAADYRTVFSGPQGERVLADLAVRCYENRKTFVAGSFDRTAFNEGRRSILLGIRNMLRVKPENKET